jgi:riboflavin kinase/FMN adenylyltransferase
VHAAVLTFDRDPDEILRPGTVPTRLLEPAEKLGAIEALGVDTVLVVPFDETVAGWAPERFVDEVLCTAFEPRAVVVGPNFRFGARATGNPDTLAAAGERCGFTVEVAPLLEVDGAPVSSTRIRGLLADGAVEAAAHLLGRPHHIVGVVVHGRGEGAALGVPTANLALDPAAALPRAGVYAARVTLPDGTVHPAGVTVGRPPTFPMAHDLVEAHLISYAGDLYGQQLRVAFVSRLRDMERYESLDELKAAMARDLAAAAAIAGE